MTSDLSFEDALALGVIGVVLAALLATALGPTRPVAQDENASLLTSPSGEVSDDLTVGGDVRERS